MVDAMQVPERFEHLAPLVELDDASGVDIREKPLIDRNPFAHPLAEAGHSPGQIERGAAHADHRQPVVSVRGEVDVIGIARQVIHHRLDFPGLRAVEPIALDRAAEGFGKQDRLAVAGDTDAVGEPQPPQSGMCRSGRRIVANDPAIAARLQSVDRPLVHFITDGCFGEENASVIGDVEIVGKAKAAVVVDRIEAPVGFVRHLLDLAIGRNAIEAHPADAHIEIVSTIERHAERLTADMGEHFHLLVVGRREAHDVAMARTGVEIVIAIEDNIFRRFDAANADQRDVAQLVILRERPAAGCGRNRRGQPMKSRTDIDLADDAVAVLQPADVDHGGNQEDGREHHAVDAAAHRQRGHAVDQKQHDQRADQRLGNRAFAAAEADAAQHRCRQDSYLQPDADIAADGAEPCGEKQRADRGQYATGSVTQSDRAPHRNA